VAAAEQCPHWLAGGLPEQVPQRDIDARDRMDRSSAAPEIQRALEHPLPQPADLRRVLSDEQRSEAAGDRVRRGGVDDRFDHSRRGVHLAEPDQALVGMDFNQQGVLAAVRDAGVETGLPQDQGFDIRYAHEFTISTARRRPAPGSVLVWT
jgi:hypothetical protein